VWFFSLDVNSELAAAAARTFFRLPYHYADIEMEASARRCEFQSERASDEPAEFSASWSIGKSLPKSPPESREFFLTERYCLYTESNGELFRARIHHEPYPLQEAKLEAYETNLLEVNGLAAPRNQPLVHYAEEVSVDIWFLEPIEDE
jgi:uncharacterized protein YqjF (DUF2071 family)